MRKKEEGKYQESIQSCTTPDPNNTWEGDKNTRKHHIQESQEVSTFSAGDQEAAKDTQYSMTNMKHDKKKKKKKTDLMSLS